MVSIYEMENGLHFRLGLQSSDNGEFDAKGGLFGIGEFGIHSRFPFGLEGNYRLWVKMNRGSDDNKGAGISLDQQLSTRLFAFGRYGINETEGAEIKKAWSAGLELHSPVKSLFIFA
ncbi:MAG: hypothetical protein E3K38_12675 [Candidatus Kuenenia stuttgartiensis]|nr:hypothetical protein [Candidatus Kuenenia stuttgartiensis]